jgi:hypothetical protein
MIIGPSLWRALSIFLVSASLAACLETVGTPEVSATKPAVKLGPKSASTASPADGAVQVRARLLSECVSEHGKIVGVDKGKLEKQCDCFAGAVVQSMSKDDREFYTQYNVVPTLTAARPNDVKKQCGIIVIDQSGPRAKYPPDS